MWGPILGAAALAAGAWWLAKRRIDEVKARTPSQGGIVNGALKGDWVLVPKGLLKADAIRRFHPRLWSASINGYKPLLAAAKWRQADGVHLPNLQKLPIRFTDSMAPPPPGVTGITGINAGHTRAAADVPTELDDLLPEHSRFSLAGISWLPSWSLDGLAVGITIFPPAAGFTSERHRALWCKVRDVWSNSKFSLWMRLLHQYGREAGPKPMPDFGAGLDYGYFTPGLRKGDSPGAKRKGYPEVDSSIAFAYWEMCAILAALGVLPKAKGQTVTDVKGASWDEWRKAVDEAFSGAVSEAEVVQGPPQALAGLAQGASTFASMFKGGAAGWAAQAVTAAVNLAQQLEGGGAKFQWWHDDWTPVAIPRSAIGSARELVSAKLMQDYVGQWEPVQVQAMHWYDVGDLESSQKAGELYDPETGQQVMWQRGEIVPMKTSEGR